MSLHGMLERETDDIDAPPRADRDGDLVGALRRGEARAAELLVTRYSERAYCLASRITGNGEDAEEVVQDAFWAVVRKIDSFRGEAAFGSWLHRIVANAAYEKLRRRQRRRQDLSLDEVLPRFDELGHHVAPVADWSANADNPALQAELRRAPDGAGDGDRRAAPRLSGCAAAARYGRALEPGHRARPGTERAGRQDPRASGAVVPAGTTGSLRGGECGHPHLLRTETAAAHHERGPPERRIPVETPDARGRKRRRDRDHASQRRFDPARSAKEWEGSEDARSTATSMCERARPSRAAEHTEPPRGE